MSQNSLAGHATGHQKTLLPSPQCTLHSALMDPAGSRRFARLPCTSTDLVVGGGDGLATPWPPDLGLHPVVTAAAAHRHEAVGGRVGGAAPAAGHLLNHTLPRQPPHQVDH
jgi:hypothetical protein